MQPSGSPRPEGSTYHRGHVIRSRREASSRYGEPNRMSTVPRSRQRLARRLGWLVVASLVVAAFAPAAFAAPGAVYTSNIDGTIVNANVNYAAKSDVYLTGGPCNGDGQLDDGTYYYMVTSPKRRAPVDRPDRQPDLHGFGWLHHVDRFEHPRHACPRLRGRRHRHHGPASPVRQHAQQRQRVQADDRRSAERH